MGLDTNVNRCVCRTLSLNFRGNNYPITVRQLGLPNGSQSYSVEIQIDRRDLVVIDSIDLADCLRQAESVLPMAFEARRIPIP